MESRFCVSLENGFALLLDGTSTDNRLIANHCDLRFFLAEC